MLAATGGRLKVVRATVKDFERMHCKTQGYDWTDQFDAAIDIAFRNLHLDVVLLFLRIYDTYGPAIEVLQAEKWLGYDMHTDSTVVIEQTQRLRRDYRSSSSTLTEATEFYYSCESNDLAAVRMLLEEERVSLGRILTKDQPQYPIYKAVKSGNVEAVKLVFEMVPDPDPDPDRGSSLRLTIYYASRDIVQLLLQYGANSEEELEDWDWRWSSRRGTEPIKSLLLEAKVKQSYHVRSTGPRTNLTLDAEDLVSTE